MSFDSIVNRILKILAILVLISLATLTVLIDIAAAKKGHLHLTWHWHVGALLLVWLCLQGAYWLVKGPIDLPDQIYCPRCHTIGEHSMVSSYRGSLGHVGYHFGGFLFSIFYSASRKQTFKCSQCGEKFKTYTNTARAYHGMYLLMLGLVVNFAWSLFDQILRVAR
jgi:hypothetical protein